MKTMFENFKSGETDSDEIASALNIIKGYLVSGDVRKEMFALTNIGKMEERYISVNKIKQINSKSNEDIMTIADLDSELRKLQHKGEQDD